MQRLVTLVLAVLMVSGVATVAIASQPPIFVAGGIGVQSQPPIFVP